MADASLGVARLRTSLDASGLKTGLRQARDETDKAVRDIDQRLTNIGSGLSRVGQRMSLFITAPLVAAGTGIVKLSQDFEKSMNRVQALSGATGESLTRLRDQARKLGADTQFSASEAADAMSFLAMAGFNVDQIYKSMPDTLNLAAAAQLDMGSAADIVSNIMTGFGIQTDQLGVAVDVLSKAFISSNTDLSMLGQGMKFVGPIASGLGVSFEETTAALGLLSNAGIQAGSAGTGLRRILGTLASEADKLGISTTDAAGNLLPLADILDELNERGLTTAEALEIFGDRGGPAMQALLSQGGQALRQFTQQLEDAGGTAQAVAETQMQGLHGMIKELQSAGEELALSLGDAGLLDMAKRLTVGLTGLVRRFNELPQPVKTAGLVIGGVAAAAGPLLIVVGNLITNIPKFVAGWQLIRTTLLPFLGTAGILGALALGFYAVWRAMDTGRAARLAMAQQFDTLIGKMANYRNALVITSEAERQASIQSLERQQAALQNILRVTEAQLAQEEAFVRRYEERSFLGQVFSGDSLAADDAARAAQELRRQVEAVRQELTAVEQQLALARTWVIVPEVEIPDPEETGEGYDAFGIPEDGTTRNVEVVVTVRTAQTAEDLFGALAGEGTAVTRAAARLGGSPELLLESMQRRAELFEAAMQRAWEIPDLTADQFDYLVRRAEELAATAEALEHAMSVSRMMGPDGTRGPLDEPDEGPVTSLYQRVLQRGMARFTAIDRALLAAADEPPPPTLNERVRARARRSFAEIDRALLAELEASRRPLDPGASWGLTTVIPRQAGGIADAWAEHLEDETERLAARFRSMDITTTNTDLAIRRERELAMERERLAKIGEDARRAEELRWRDIVAAQRWGGAAARRYTEQVNLQAATIRLAAQEGITLTEALQRLTGTLRTTAEQAEFNARAGQLSLQLGRRREREEQPDSGGLSEAKGMIEAQKDAAEAQRQAGFDFAQAVIGAGQGFVSAIEAFQAGNVGGGIAALGSSIGDVITGLGSLGVAGFGPWGALVGAGAGLLGGIINLFSGGRSDADRAAAEARRVGNVPSIELRFEVNQTNHYQGGPTQPEVEQAFRRQANTLWEELYRRHLGPRLDRIEQRLGIAGAPA